MNHERNGSRSGEKRGKPGFAPLAILATMYAAEVNLTRADLLSRDDRTSLVSRPGKGNLSISVVVGNGASGEKYAESIGPHLEEFGPVHFVTYPKRSFSADAVGDRLLEVGELDKGMPRAMITFSMGMMVMNHLFSKAEFINEAGDINCLISDSGVVRKENLKPRTRGLLEFGGRLVPSHTLARCFDTIIGSHDNQLYEELSQWAWMLHNNGPKNGELAEVGKRIPHKYYLSAASDQRVKLDEAIRDLNAAYDGGWEPIVSSRRKERSHTEGFSKPEDFRDILGKLNKR